MNTRSKIFWALWLIVVISILWWMSSIMAHGRSHHLAPKPVIQGLGAADLIAKHTAIHNAPLIPSIIVPPKPIRSWYFAVTAKDNAGSESDFSNEVVYTNWSRTNVIMTLAWDSRSGTNFISHYTIYKGIASGNYRWTYDAGTNLCLTFPLFGFALSNVVVTVACTNGGTNIAFASRMSGPWSNLNLTNWTETNPSGPRYFRGIGKIGNRITINVIHQ